MSREEPRPRKGMFESEDAYKLKVIEWQRLEAQKGNCHTTGEESKGRFLGAIIDPEPTKGLFESEKTFKLRHLAWQEGRLKR